MSIFTLHDQRPLLYYYVPPYYMELKNAIMQNAETSPENNTSHALPDPGEHSKWLKWYFHLLYFLASSSMAAIAIIMVVQVIARYVFNASLIWAEELCRYILIWITFLFAGLAYHKGELVAVDFVPELLSKRARYILKTIVTLPVFAFLWLMVINGYEYSERFAAQKIPALDFIWMSLSGGQSLNVSISWIYHSVTIGSALLFIHILLALYIEGRALLSSKRSISTQPPHNQT